MIAGKIIDGRVYRLVELRLVRDGEGNHIAMTVPLGQYRVVGFATEFIFRREAVVCAGVGGPDDGKLFVHSLGDFVLRFVDETPVPEAATEPSPVPPEKLEKDALNAAGWKERKEPSPTGEKTGTVWYPPEGGDGQFSLGAAVMEQRQRAASVAGTTL